MNDTPNLLATCSQGNLYAKSIVIVIVILTLILILIDLLECKLILLLSS